MQKKYILCVGLCAVLGSSPAVAEFKGDISPKEAFWRASTEANVYILDIRSGQEWKWVGHPGPTGLADSKRKLVSFWSGANLVDKVINIAWKVDDGAGGLKANLAFDTDVNNRFTVDDILLTLCRSGGRALPAAQTLGALGYTTYRIENGFQGVRNDETQSGPDTLYRNVNGWVNRRLPYNDSPAGAYFPSQ